MIGRGIFSVRLVGQDGMILSLIHISSAPPQPFDVLVTGDVRILAVNPLARPISHPVWRMAQELRGAKRVGEQDEQFALVSLLPQFQHPVLRRSQLVFRIGQSGHGHGQLVRVGPDSLEIVDIGEIGIRAAGKEMCIRDRLNNSAIRTSLYY